MPPSRWKLVLALGISLALHAIGGLAWIASRDTGVGGGISGVDAKVESPDRDDFSLKLLDPPKKTIVVEGKAAPPAKTPAALPPSVVVEAPPGPGPGAGTPSSHSPEHPGSSPAPSRPAGGLFGGKVPTGTIVFVVDRSSSMGVDGLLPRAVNETLAAIKELDAKTRFQVVAYNGGASSTPGGLKRSDAETQSNVERWLKTLPAEGRSDHRAGIREALSYRPTHILLVTDADDLDGRTAGELSALLRGVKLDAVVLGPGGVRAATTTALDRLTEGLRGSVRYLEP